MEIYYFVHTGILCLYVGEPVNISCGRFRHGGGEVTYQYRNGGGFEENQTGGS